MKLSIIIPVFNEEKTLKKALDEVKKINIGKIKKEIIIVDDASIDKTKEILKKIHDPIIKIFFHKENKGKGAAIRTGLKHVTGDLVIIQDADLEYKPKEYPKLLKPILKDNAEIVYGSRIESIKKDRNMYRVNFYGNLFLTFMTNLIYRSNITDMETGYKLFKSHIIKNMELKSERFDIEPEITSKILKGKYKIHEVPIEFKGRKYHEGKKITWVDGVIALYCLFKFRFTN